MFWKINKLIQNFLFPIFLLVFISLFFTNKIEAASLLLQPTASTISVGNIVSIKIIVNTQSQVINNAEATIQFPTDLLEVISTTKSSSIFNLWVEEPSFSNSTGRVTFNGGVPTPGFNGSNGYVATVTFKARKQGTASVIFTDGAVRANDGLGTDVLTSKTGGVIQIVAPKEIKVIEKITTKSFVPSIRFEGIQGIVKLAEEKNISNADYYTLGLDDESSFKVKKDQLINYEYYLPVSNEGSHTITVVSFDKTGKYTENVLTFMSPLISVPVLSLSSKEIVVGKSVDILGKTDYPNKQVSVVLELDGKEISRYTQVTGIDGSFLVTTDAIKTKGLISIYARTLLSDKVISGQSEKVFLKVGDKEVVRITLAILYPLVASILIIIILLIILFLLYLGWHKYFSLKKKFEDETRQTAIEVRQAMLSLKEELNGQLGSLEKVREDRNLNEKEESIFKEIKDNVDKIDEFIEKKLKKIL